MQIYLEVGPTNGLYAWELQFGNPNGFIVANGDDTRLPTPVGEKKSK